MALTLEEERRRQQMGGAMPPKIDLEALDNRPQQVREPDRRLVQEVKAGLHPTMKPFQHTSDGSTVQNPNRIIVEAEHAPDAPAGARRFVDLGAATPQNLKDFYTGRDDVGYTPAQVAKYLGRGLDKDAPFTTNTHIGKFNYNMRNDLMNGSYMVRPDGMRGGPPAAGGGGAQAVKPMPQNATMQKNNVLGDPTPIDPVTGEPIALKTFDDISALHDKNLVAPMMNEAATKASGTARDPFGNPEPQDGLTEMQTIGAASRMAQPKDAETPHQVKTGEKRRSLTGQAGSSIDRTRDANLDERRALALKNDPDANSPLNRGAKQGVAATLSKGKDLAKQGYQAFSDIYRNYDKADHTFVDKSVVALEGAAGKAWNKISDYSKNNKWLKRGGKVLDFAGKTTEKLARNPYVQAGLAAMDGVGEVIDWATDGSAMVNGGITSLQFDSEKGKYTVQPLNKPVEVNAQTFKDFHRMVRNEIFGKVDFEERFGKGKQSELPKRDVDLFTSGNYRAEGGLAVEAFLDWPRKMSADAQDDPQMTMFVAQAMQFMKDAKALPALTAQQQRANIDGARDKIVDMAHQFVQARVAKKNAEWAAWAKARGNRSFIGKTLGTLGLDGANWKDPATGEEREGAPTNDPILERTWTHPSQFERQTGGILNKKKKPMPTTEEMLGVGMM